LNLFLWTGPPEHFFPGFGVSEIGSLYLLQLFNKRYKYVIDVAQIKFLTNGNNVS
jgi:hypothetical protein